MRGERENEACSGRRREKKKKADRRERRSLPLHKRQKTKQQVLSITKAKSKNEKKNYQNVRTLKILFQFE